MSEFPHPKTILLTVQEAEIIQGILEWVQEQHGELEPEEQELLNKIRAADGLLIAAAPELYEALLSVNKLISEAAMTGFNWRDGDWAQRLFESQRETSAALAKARGERE